MVLRAVAVAALLLTAACAGVPAAEPVPIAATPPAKAPPPPPETHVRWPDVQSRKGKTAISKAAAEAQIAALRGAILTDSVVAPGQIAAGQLVSQKLDFGKSADRTLRVRVRIAGDEHSFTIAAPKQYADAGDAAAVQAPAWAIEIGGACRCALSDPGLISIEKPGLSGGI